MQIILSKQQIYRAVRIGRLRHSESENLSQASGAKDTTPHSDVVGALTESAFAAAYGRYFDGTGKIIKLTVNSFGKPDFGRFIQVRGGVGACLRPREIQKYPQLLGHAFSYVSAQAFFDANGMNAVYTIHGWIWGHELAKLPLTAKDPSRPAYHLAPNEILKDPCTLPEEGWEGTEYEEDPSLSPV